MEQVEKTTVQPSPFVLCVVHKGMSRNRECRQSTLEAARRPKPLCALMHDQLSNPHRANDRASLLHACAPKVGCSDAESARPGVSFISASRALVCGRVFALCLRMLSPFRFKFTPAPRIALMNDIRRERTTAARIMDFRRVPIQDRISYKSVESSRCHAGGCWVSMRIESESRLELTGLIPFELVKDNTDTGSHTHSFGHGARSGGSI